ncbi:zinc transporter ZupT [uncultured Corynebacterium sp.]|uniref:zinc transporter ZupT n=1 Tax=uncultured Corynebacterium sp. TaxID=159447 RepID=UPI0025EB8597|nr:zinc transporter ZupT [uncultured Corynebacterium sp.]
MDLATATPGAVAVALGISLLAGLSTGLGGLVVVMKRSPGPGFLAGALGFSAGVMVYISFVELLPEGIDGLLEAGNASAELWGVVAFFAGIGLIALIDRFVPEEINPHEEPDASGVSRARLRNVGVLSAVAIAVHNFPEGFATFAVALADPALALPIAVAIAIHNIPEGIAVAVPLRQATGSRWKAAGWATLSGLAEPLGAVIGFLLLQPFLGPQTLGYTFAAIAGIMVFVSLDKLLPTAIATGKHHTAIYGMIIGMAVMAASLLMLPG